jgi:hypothetical protein
MNANGELPVVCYGGVAACGARLAGQARSENLGDSRGAHLSGRPGRDDTDSGPLAGGVAEHIVIEDAATEIDDSHDQHHKNREDEGKLYN